MDGKFIAVDHLHFTEDVAGGDASTAIEGIRGANRRDPGPYLLLSTHGPTYRVRPDSVSPQCGAPRRTVVNTVPCPRSGPDHRHLVEVQPDYAAGTVLDVRAAAAAVAVINRFFERCGKGAALRAMIDQYTAELNDPNADT